MYSADSLEELRARALAAIAQMARRGIPPHPANYAIWYAYQGGHGPAPAEDRSTRELGALIQEIRQETRRVADKSMALEDWLARTGREIARRQDRTARAIGGTTTDFLTGLASRSRFEARLGEEIAGLWRSGGVLSLVILDIDRFRQFDERHGRPMAREALFTLGGLLEDMAGGHDLAARYGHGAFAVLRTGASLDQAMALGEALRRRLASGRLVNLETGEEYGTLTISVGAAVYRLGEPVGAFVRRAERALRHAKDQGGNRVCPRGSTAVGY